MKTKKQTVRGWINIGCKTLGEVVAARARVEVLELTPENYWGPRLMYAHGRYYMEYAKQGFGGMFWHKIQIDKAELLTCNSIEDLQQVIRPQFDYAEGDPSNYSPRDVREIKIDADFLEPVAA